MRNFEEREKCLIDEMGSLKEQLLQAQTTSSDTPSSNKAFLQLFEGNRLRRERIALVYENARLSRENTSLNKEL